MHHNKIAIRSPGVNYNDIITIECTNDRDMEKTLNRNTTMGLGGNEKLPAKNKVKSALKASFTDSHIHNFPQVLAEAPVTLKSYTPIKEFIVILKELLKNGQLVD
jgi:hypothetical protein